MSDVVGKHAHVFHGVYTGRVNGARVTVEQHVADQPTADQARTTYARIVDELGECRDEPAGHWHYGPKRILDSGVGRATWMITRDGDGSPSGGVIVARSGRHLTVVESSGQGTSRRTEQLAEATLQQLS